MNTFPRKIVSKCLEDPLEQVKRFKMEELMKRFQVPVMWTREAKPVMNILTDDCVLASDYNTLAVDHARCVQDARRMAELVIEHLGADTECPVTLSMTTTVRAAHLENTEISERNLLRSMAQHVLETWKEQP